MSILDINFVEYRPEYGLETVKMWRQSFQRAMNLEEQNHIDELTDQLDYFSSISPASIQIAIDCRSSAVAGLMVLVSGKLDHLYVNVGYQGIGLGSKFLTEAKLRSPQGIELYTFQKNIRAQSFYKHHGFREVERGYADFESNPWASSKEELADIKYRWVP
ncbi:MAG: GNAT family N-acetyltransferase [Gammaproteobacteria bacterium]|jgi:ribosomal protein S18 acetylase RimI-like enzyme|nr:GNAT family N-acetyltransferase [Gammaproteobacteria bacterium]MBT7371001.1 GNAT family N-acetyltransferase [Gammaproteobacteria bacterium]